MLTFSSRYRRFADVAQSAERVLGKDEVTGSSPVISSQGNASPASDCGVFFYSRVPDKKCEKVCKNRFYEYHNEYHHSGRSIRSSADLTSSVVGWTYVAGICDVLDQRIAFRSVSAGTSCVTASAVAVVCRHEYGGRSRTPIRAVNCLTRS